LWQERIQKLDSCLEADSSLGLDIVSAVAGFHQMGMGVVENFVDCLELDRLEVYRLEVDRLEEDRVPLNSRMP